MRISTRGEYGLRALMEIGARTRSAVSLREIARRQGISLAYLEQIMPLLKAAGLVKSRRGAHGGYILSRPPEEISLYEILIALGESLDVKECLTDDLPEEEMCPSSGHCAVQEVWMDMRDALTFTLRRRTLASVIKRQRRHFKARIYSGDDDRNNDGNEDVMRLIPLDPQQ